MRTFDDIIPPSRRSEGQMPSAKPRPPLEPPKRPRFPYATLLGALAIIALSVGALFYFSTAKVTITPNSASAAVENNFTATKSSGALPFEIITAEKIASQGVKSTGSQNVTTNASGKITIYNTQSAPQRLVANTRFATAAGLIFRIRTAVTVPAGSTAAPGSVEATVYADQPGATYNVGPASFTIPGFAGTAQEGAVYARSTGAMTGGASGTMPVTDAATQAQAEQALKTALVPDLEASLVTEIPAGYVLVLGSATTTFATLAPEASSATGTVDIRVQGTVTAVVFPNAALARAIAASVSGLGYQGEQVTLAATDTIMLTPTAGLPDSSATTFSFALSGTAALTYTVDTARIAAAVSGKTRKEAEVVLTNYPEVKTALIVLRPFWRQAFPQDPASITVVVEEPSR